MACSVYPVSQTHVNESVSCKDWTCLFIQA